MTVETVSTVEEQLGFPTHAEHVRTGWASARRLARRLDVVLLLLLALVPLWRFTNGAWTNYDTDAFTYLYDASRIVHGQVPYRDFFNFIGPAALWLPAAWMAIFGVSGDGAQVLLVAILALLGAALYAVTLQLTRRRLLSLFAPAFVLLTMPVHFPWPYHNWYGDTALVATLLTVSAWLRTGRLRWLVLGGIGCAATGLLVQTYGVALGAALGGFLILRADNWRMVARSAASFALGLAMVLVPIAAYFLAQGALLHLVYDTLVFPNKHLILTNKVPFATNLTDWLSFQPTWVGGGRRAIILRIAEVLSTFGVLGIALSTLVPAGLLVFDAIVARLRRASSPPDATHGLLLACSLVTIVSFAFWLRYRQDMMHLAWTTVVAYPTLLGFIGRIQDRSVMRAVRVALVGLAAAAGAGFLVITSPPTSTTIDRVAARGALAAYIRDHTAPDDEIAIIGYGGSTYFYSRPAAIGYTQVLPYEDFNTPAQVAEMRDQILRRRPKLVIFEVGISCAPVPDASGCLIPLPADYRGSSGPLPDRVVGTYGAICWIYTMQ